MSTLCPEELNPNLQPHPVDFIVDVIRSFVVISIWGVWAEQGLAFTSISACLRLGLWMQLGRTGAVLFLWLRLGLGVPLAGRRSASPMHVLLSCRGPRRCDFLFHFPAQCCPLVRSYDNMVHSMYWGWGMVEVLLCMGKATAQLPSAADSPAPQAWAGTRFSVEASACRRSGRRVQPIRTASIYFCCAHVLPGLQMAYNDSVAQVCAGGTHAWHFCVRHCVCMGLGVAVCARCYLHQVLVRQTSICTLHAAACTAPSELQNCAECS